MLAFLTLLVCCCWICVLSIQVDWPLLSLFWEEKHKIRLKLEFLKHSSAFLPLRLKDVQNNRPKSSWTHDHQNAHWEQEVLLGSCVITARVKWAILSGRRNFVISRRMKRRTHAADLWQVRGSEFKLCHQYAPASGNSRKFPAFARSETKDAFIKKCTFKRRQDEETKDVSLAYITVAKIDFFASL